MNQKEKLITRILSLPKDFTYKEAVSLLGYLGYKEVRTGKTSGSRVRFIHEDGDQFVMHKPHPDKVLKSYLVAALAAVAIRRSNDA